MRPGFLALTIATLLLTGTGSSIANDQAVQPVLTAQSLAHSLATDKDNSSLRTGLHDAIKRLGKNPLSAQDLVSLGDEFASTDKLAASALYYEALRLKDDAAIWAKLRSIQRSPNEFDFGPYMADVQRKIKDKWLPPKGHERDLIKVVFTVNSDGTVKDVRLENGVQFAPSNKAALDAVSAAAPFRQLPPSIPTLGIHFTFDTNLLDRGSSGKR